MKSKLLTYYNLELEKGIIQSIILLSKIQLESFKSLVAKYENNLNSPLIVSEEELSELAKKTNITIEELRNIMDETLSLINFCDEEKDTIENIIDDFISSGRLDKQIKEIYLINYSYLEERYKQVFKIKQREKYVVSNKFQKILKISCDPILVPYVNPSFDSRKYKVSEYIPKMESIFPLTNIRIRYRDLNKNDINIAFCASEDVIDEMINELLAAKIGLSELKKVINK